MSPSARPKPRTGAAPKARRARASAAARAGVGPSPPARPAPPARPQGPRAAASAEPAAASAGGFAWWRLAVALAVAAPLALGVQRVVQVKVSQHVVLEPLAPLVGQGQAPGNLSAVASIKADGHGGIVTLCRVGDAWRVQHFDQGLTLLAWRDLPAHQFGELSDLAPLPGGGGAWLASLDGSLWRLGPDLKPAAKPVKTGRSELRSIDVLPDGSLLALDVSTSSLVALDAQGRQTADTPVKSAAGARSLTLVPEGVAWLEFRGDAVWVRVLDLTGRTLRRFLVEGVGASAPDRLAASGNVLIINDAAGAKGVVFYDVSGRPLGNNLGVGANPVINPGFVAGDPAGGVAYIHYGAGLVKVRLPWREKP